MRVSRVGIDEIKRRNDLAEVVTEHGIELKKRGRTLFGLCAFHAEKTASFGVNREVGLFHCFGCGASGDVIAFVSRFHRISFKEALEKLALRAGVSLEAFRDERPSLSRDEMARRLHEQAAARHLPALPALPDGRQAAGRRQAGARLASGGGRS